MKILQREAGYTDANHFSQNSMFTLAITGETIYDALLRPMDKLVRIGGEEFLVILPNTDVNGAKAVTERLLRTVYDLNIPHASSEYERVTLSAGLAVKHADDNKTIDYVMLEADKNLYVAKTSGRNQLVAPTAVSAGKIKASSHSTKLKA